MKQKGVDLLLAEIFTKMAFFLQNRDDPRVQFFEALRNNDVEKLKCLIQEGADVNTRDFQDRPALVVAIEENNDECFELLLKSGADVNVVDGWKKTPLINAVLKHNRMGIDRLLQAGAGVNKADVQGNTALFYACKLGLNSVAKDLIAKGSDINVTNIVKNTALIEAAANNQALCIATLVEAGADVKAKNVSGDTALVHAIKKKNIQCFKPLLNLNDLNAEMDEIPEKLNFDRKYPNRDADEYEFSHANDDDGDGNPDEGAVNTFKTLGYWALFYSMQKRDHECVQTLALAGVDLKTAKYRWLEHVAWAASTGNHKIVELFIHAECDVNASHRIGFRPLRIAAESGNFRSVQLLLEAGADVNRGIHGRNALAAYMGIRGGKNKNLCTLLFAAGEISGKYKVPNSKEWKSTAPLMDFYLEEQEPKWPCLKSICRGIIRNRLMNINPHVNLFSRVTKLGLPSLLAKYLVYDMSLEEDLSVKVGTLSLEESVESLPGGRRGKSKRNRHNQKGGQPPS